MSSEQGGNAPLRPVSSAESPVPPDAEQPTLSVTEDDDWSTLGDDWPEAREPDWVYRDSR
jgi:hypothetical protein